MSQQIVYAVLSNEVYGGCYEATNCYNCGSDYFQIKIFRTREAAEKYKKEFNIASTDWMANNQYLGKSCAECNPNPQLDIIKLPLD